MSWKKIYELIYTNLKSENLDLNLCGISNRSPSSPESQISSVDTKRLSNVTTFSQGRWLRVGTVCFISFGQGGQTAASLVSFADTVIFKYPYILGMPYNALC